jgi:putative addiction module component (TIGR02574 family)
MSQLLKKLAAEAQQLSADERVELVETILAQLPQTNPDWDAAWFRECEVRMASVDRGQMRTFDFNEVMSQVHTRLKQV